MFSNSTLYTRAKFQIKFYLCPCKPCDPTCSTMNYIRSEPNTVTIKKDSYSLYLRPESSKDSPGTTNGSKSKLLPPLLKRRLHTHTWSRPLTVQTKLFGPASHFQHLFPKPSICLLMNPPSLSKINILCITSLNAGNPLSHQPVKTCPIYNSCASRTISLLSLSSPVRHVVTLYALGSRSHTAVQLASASLTSSLNPFELPTRFPNRLQCPPSTSPNTVFK